LTVPDRELIEDAVRAAAARRRRPFTPEQMEAATALALDLHRVIRAHGVPWWEAQELSAPVHAALDTIRLRARLDY
jgi:hypothetical protein